MKFFMRLNFTLLLLFSPSLLSALEMAGGEWEMYFWDDHSAANQNRIYGIDYFDVQQPPFQREGQGILDTGGAPFTQNYGQGPLTPGMAAINGFSAQYVKHERLYLYAGTNYRFIFSADDYLRIRLNTYTVFSNLFQRDPNLGRQVINFQTQHSGWYTLTLDLLELAGDARVSLSMEQTEANPPPIVPGCSSGSDFWEAQYYQNNLYIGNRIICGTHLNEIWDENRRPLPGMKTPITHNWYQVVYKSNERCFNGGRAHFDFKGNNALAIYLTDPYRSDIHKDFFNDFDADFVAFTSEDGFASSLKHAEKMTPGGNCGRVWAIQKEMGAEAIATINIY